MWRPTKHGQSESHGAIMKIVIKAFADRHESSVDDAGERKGFAAAADSIGNQRSDMQMP